MNKLYMTVEEAAAFVGIGVNAMRNCLNSADPPPHLMNGNRALFRRSALMDYFKKQEVRR